MHGVVRNSVLEHGSRETEREFEMKKIYVGNLPFSATEDQLRQLFGQHGNVESVALITDRTTGQPRGFGFVEMSGSDADKAIQALNGQSLDGRTLNVNEARPREGGGGGGGFNRGGGGGGGYNRNPGGRSPRW